VSGDLICLTCGHGEESHESVEYRGAKARCCRAVGCRCRAYRDTPTLREVEAERDAALAALKETSDFRDTLIARRDELIAERDAALDLADKRGALQVAAYERADAAEAETRRLRTALASLLDRIRPDSEAAPWVVEELRALLSRAR
jgi:hypothetical protein